MIDKALKLIQAVGANTEATSMLNKLSQLIGTLGNHSVSVKELRAILACMRSDHLSFSHIQSARLLAALQTMSERDGPESYFNFTGDSSAIVLPPIRRWPTQSGFTVSMWLRLEKPSDIVVAPGPQQQPQTKHTPYIYSFQTTNGLGYAAYFEDNKLTLDEFGAGHKLAVRKVCDFNFCLEQWYMVTVTYHHNRLRKSLIKVYVNGNNVMEQPFKIANTSLPFLRCCLGASDSLRPDTFFVGQIGVFYLFDKPLSVSHSQIITN